MSLDLYNVKIHENGYVTAECAADNCETIFETDLESLLFGEALRLDELLQNLEAAMEEDGWHECHCEECGEPLKEDDRQDYLAAICPVPEFPTLSTGGRA